MTTRTNHAIYLSQSTITYTENDSPFIWITYIMYPLYIPIVYPLYTIMVYCFNPMFCKLFVLLVAFATNKNNQIPRILMRKLQQRSGTTSARKAFTSGSLSRPVLDHRWTEQHDELHLYSTTYLHISK